MNSCIQLQNTDMSMRAGNAYVHKKRGFLHSSGFFGPTKKYTKVCFTQRPGTPCISQDSPGRNESFRAIGLPGGLEIRGFLDQNRIENLLELNGEQAPHNWSLATCVRAYS